MGAGELVGNYQHSSGRHVTLDPCATEARTPWGRAFAEFRFLPEKLRRRLFFNPQGAPRLMLRTGSSRRLSLLLFVFLSIPFLGHVFLLLVPSFLYVLLLFLYVLLLLF